MIVTKSVGVIPDRAQFRAEASVENDRLQFANCKILDGRTFLETLDDPQKLAELRAWVAAQNWPD